MKKNMGVADRAIRILIVLAVAALYYFELLSGPLAYGALALAGIFLLTSFIGFCPIYAALGLRSKKS